MVVILPPFALSVCEVTSAHYGWRPLNTLPRRRPREISFPKAHIGTGRRPVELRPTLA